MYINYNIKHNNYQIEFKSFKLSNNNFYEDNYFYYIQINKVKHLIDLNYFIKFYEKYLNYTDSIDSIDNQNQDLSFILNLDLNINDEKDAVKLGKLYYNLKKNITNNKYLFTFLEKINYLIVDYDDDSIINKDFYKNIFFYIFFLQNIKKLYDPYSINEILYLYDINNQIDFELDNF